MSAYDKYKPSNSSILEPPTNFFGRLKHLGPGFILSASIVGSGELIATTTLGARAGFITFWIILVSCVIKVAIQLEFGKHSILHGETAMAAFNGLPGFRMGQAHWTVWTFFFLLITKVSQLGGIIGGVALTFHMIFPGLDVPFWLVVTGILASLIVYNGKYSIIEKASLLMIALFTLMTFTSLYFLQYTDYSFGTAEVLSGLSFQLPKEAVAIAIGAFGITGVGGDEIVHYTYWCTEKGYARYTGIRDDTDEWKARAKGWIKVMHLDAILAMVVYTVVTAAFYLLGAAVLNASETVPQGYDMVESLSHMYTETLGSEARLIFLIGALVVLFSTLFSALAAWTRQYTDIFGQVGWINFYDQKQRERSISILAWTLPIIWGLLFLFFKSPVAMVIIGGLITSVILFLVVGAAIYIRYYRSIDGLHPNKMYDIALWISILVICAVGVYGIVQWI